MKTVTLVDMGNAGHHNAYMRLFIGALLELDCRVICLIPDTRPIQEWVDVHYPARKDRVTYQALPFHRDRWQFLGRLRERFNILYDWHHIDREVAEIEDREGIRTDLVFMCFLDLYLINRIPPVLMDTIFPRNWSGLFFFPSTVSQDPELLNRKPQLKDRDILFRARRCKGIGLLNNWIYESYSRRIGKPVVLFPDVADDSPPDPENRIAKEIREKAQGRTVVGTIGLERHKCGYEFLLLAKHADPKRYFFAFTGPFFDYLLKHYSPEQVREIREFTENLPENCYWNTGHLDEGAEYNAVINAFDIVWIAYHNFFGSSNRLTKASFFHKLVLSDDKYCIGDIVSRFNLGETMPDMQPGTMVRALDQLQARIDRGDLPETSWAEYARMQSPDVLKERFRAILSFSQPS